jgi:hypothetical protein
MPTILGNITGTPQKKKYDPTKDPNNVTVTQHGPRPVFIDRFSNVFYERNVSLDEGHPIWERCDQATEGSVARIRVYVRYEKLKNLTGGPLELSKVINLYWGAKAEWALLISYALAIDVTTVAAMKNTLDIDTLKGKRVMATTKPSQHNNALLHKFQPAPVEDEDVVIAAAPAPIVDEDDEATLLPPSFDERAIA